MGTGGGLRFAQANLDPRFFFLNGDSLLDINLLDLSARAGDADATLALRSMPDISRYGEVELAPSGRIIRFAERSSRGGAGLINGGVGYFSRRILEAIPEGREVSIEREVYPRLVELRKLNGRVYDRPFIDIGVPDDYALAQTKVPALLRRGAVIFDRDGVLNEDIGYAYRADQIRWIEEAKAAVKHVNDAGLLALVATNQSGVARGYYGEDEVKALHRWMIGELRAAGANIDGIVYCPYHPEGSVESYRQASPMRKPAPGMIQALIAQHRVDRLRCALIGDKTTDIEAATAAGIQGVRYQGGSLLRLVEQVVARLVSPASIEP
jgi:D-glycero-D-manno-heptose 1,7-bisphosphate phosphatase